MVALVFSVKNVKNNMFYKKLKSLTIIINSIAILTTSCSGTKEFSSKKYAIKTKEWLKQAKYKTSNNFSKIFHREEKPEEKLEIIDEKPISQPAQSNKIKQNFVYGTKDVPLADDLIKIGEDSLNFDLDYGSIISSSYKTEQDISIIQKFYQETLLQMGWNLTENSSELLKFTRDNEKLTINFKKLNDQEVNQKNELIINFTVSATVNSSNQSGIFFEE